MVCRIKGEKVYDDKVEVQDVEVKVEDFELVVETIVKKVKLEIKEMYKLYTDKQETFECDLFLEGTDLKQSSIELLLNQKT